MTIQNSFSYQSLIHIIQEAKVNGLVRRGPSLHQLHPKDLNNIESCERYYVAREQSKEIKKACKIAASTLHFQNTQSSLVDWATQFAAVRMGSLDQDAMLSTLFWSLLIKNYPALPMSVVSSDNQYAHEFLLIADFEVVRIADLKFKELGDFFAAVKDGYLLDPHISKKPISLSNYSGSKLEAFLAKKNCTMIQSIVDHEGGPHLKFYFDTIMILSSRLMGQAKDHLDRYVRKDSRLNSLAFASSMALKNLQSTTSEQEDSSKT